MSLAPSWSGNNFSGALTRVAGEGVGSYAIQRGTLALSTNYELTFVEANLLITPRPATVTAHNKSRKYGDANPDFTADVTNTVNGDTLNFVLTTTATEVSGIGNYVITVTLGANPNYDVSPYHGTLTVEPRPASVTANNKTKMYGTANPELDATVTGAANGDVLNFSLATTATTSSDVGIYPIQVTLGSNPNYVVQSTAGTLTIEKANQTINFPVVGPKNTAMSRKSRTAWRATNSKR